MFAYHFIVTHPLFQSVNDNVSFQEGIPRNQVSIRKHLQKKITAVK